MILHLLLVPHTFCIFFLVCSLGTEWVGIAYRPHTIIIGHVGFATGQMILAGLAYAIRDWKLLQITGSAPVFGLFCYLWWVM